MTRKILIQYFHVTKRYWNFMQLLLSAKNPSQWQAFSSQVRCARGYTLTGPPSECMIQDLFTNEFMDARLMPECVKVCCQSSMNICAHFYFTLDQFILLILLIHPIDRLMWVFLNKTKILYQTSVLAIQLT